jgi:hypothetical protein
MDLIVSFKMEKNNSFPAITPELVTKNFLAV